MARETETIDESPVIVLPTDQDWQQLLKDKKQLYLDRLKRKGYGYQPPEVRNATHMGYAIRIIDELFEHGQIGTWPLSMTLFAEQKNMFNLERFANACGAIDTYTHEKQVLETSIASERESLQKTS